MKKALLLGAAFALASGMAYAQAPGAYQNPMQNQPMGSPPQSSAAPMSNMARSSTTEIPLSRVSNVASLNSASVQDASGNSVGTVQKVVTGMSGKPTAVQVDAGTFLGTTSKIVSIKAANLKYDRNRNVLTTTLTKGQIKALPPATRM